MDEIKSAAKTTYERLRLILFQLEHLLSDFQNDMPKSKTGNICSEEISELVKTAEAAIYKILDFCCSILECESASDLELILSDKDQNETIIY